MIGKYHSERSEESSCGADAFVRHASRGEGTPPTITGFFAALLMNIRLRVILNEVKNPEP